MSMVSSEALAGEMGLSHKAVKKLILDFNVKGIPSGSSDLDPGKTQRMVLVDSESFHNSLSGNTKTFRRKKKKKDGEGEKEAPKKK